MNKWTSSRNTQCALRSTPCALTGFFWSLLMLITALGLPTLAQAELRAELDRQQIQSHESVELTIEIDQRTSDEPDFSILQADFDVSQTRQSSAIRVINGQMSATSQWLVTLTPKRTGTLTIPSFTLDGQQTPPLTLEVSDQAVEEAAASSATRLQTQAKSSEPIFLVLEFSNTQPYVQEPVLATLKIYHAVTILQGGLSDWTPTHARIQRVPGQTESSDTVDGKPYQITQVVYWITPQQSGKLILPSLVFQAEVADNNSRSGSWSPFGGLSSQRISQATAPQSLAVRPQPASYPANTPWLPAKGIEIQDSWTPNSRQVQVGQAITRTLTLKATGQWGSLIPQIDYPPQNALKFYPDQSPPQDQMTQQAVTGSKTLSIAIVPTQPGDLQLPRQTLTWWNTQTDQLQVTEIPTTRLTVLPAPGQTLSVEPSPPNGSAKNAESAENATAKNNNEQTATSDTAQTTPNNQAKPSYWQWLTLIFAGLWLLTLLLALLLAWRLSKRPRQPSFPTAANDHDDPAFDTNQAIEQLKQALHAHDLAAIERALIGWGQTHFRDPYLLSLRDLQQQIDNAAVKQLLQQLSDQRYNPHPNATGQSNTAQAHVFDALLPLLKTLSRTTTKKNQRSQLPLPELYPK